MNQPTDFLGQELYPGDKVIYTDNEDLKKGIMTKINPHLSVIHICDQDWNPKDVSQYTWSWNTRKHNKRIVKWQQQ